MKKVSVGFVVMLAVWLVVGNGVLAGGLLPQPRIFEITPLSANPGERINIIGENFFPPLPPGTSLNNLGVVLENLRGGAGIITLLEIVGNGGSWGNEVISMYLPPNLWHEPIKVSVMVCDVHSGIYPFYYTVGITTTTVFSTGHYGAARPYQQLSMSWCRNSQSGNGVNIRAVIPPDLVFPGMLGGCWEGLGCTYEDSFADDQPGIECALVYGYAAKPGRYLIYSTFEEPRTGFVQTIVDKIMVRQALYLPLVRR